MSFLKREKPRGMKVAVGPAGQNPNDTLPSYEYDQANQMPASPLSPTQVEKPYFSTNYGDSIDNDKEKHSIRKVSTTDGTFSPRSSVSSIPIQPERSPQLKESYKGFHANKSVNNIPPLREPIKPKFKKKGSLLGKFIYSNRKDGESLGVTTSNEEDGRLHSSRALSFGAAQNNNNSSTGRGSSFSHKHKFRIPSISSFDHRHDNHNDQHWHHNKLESKNPSLRSNSIQMDPKDESIEENEDTQRNTSTTSENQKTSQPIFDLNLNEMHGIIKSPTDESTRIILPEIKRVNKSSISNMMENGGSWKAPDSWDVKFSDNKKEILQRDDSSIMSSCSSGYCSESEPDSIDGRNNSHRQHHHHHHHHHHTVKPLELFGNLPVLFGSRHVNSADQLESKTSPFLRIFKEDNTFSTIRASIESTTAELLTIVQKKFFLESIANCQISVNIGSSVKVLESFEKPLQIQLGLLKLSGYTDKEDLVILGREDLSFICKFVLEDVYLRSLTHEEELLLSKDYVDVNISGLNLKNIPIIFHQHTYEIEKLNVADNPSIYIPLDFIQSCNNLTSIIFSKNGCSKFPLNFLEAKKLTNLDMQKNYLDELPIKFGHLKNLTTLKLNSNQLQNLPKSFAKLQQLRILNLSSNYFHKYPEEISELSSLVDLDLSYNDLSEIPESIGKLKNLTKLNLCTNKLETAIPQHFTQLVSLKRLDIRYNKISNIDVLGSLPLLEVAYASKNNISAFSDRMDNLRLLHFDRNPITDLQFENILPILTVLDLSRAKVTSVPPEFISRIPNIEKLVLDKNHLVNLPEQLGDLTKLAVLSLYGNNIQELPASIGKLTSLQYLDVHSNNLQSLPKEIWSLKSLTVLNAASNILNSFPKPPLADVQRISSSINLQDIGGPNSQSNPPKINAQSLADSLLVLILADNRLNDEVFESISILSELKTLNLSYNDIIEIPEGAARHMNKLTEFYLSGNEIVSLPTDDLEHLKSLKLLHLNNNKFVSLPAELAKLTNLQHLDVGSNQLKYNISNWPYDWNWHWNKSLKYLNFSGNKRFEIKQSHVKNPETGEYFDSLLVLENLKVLGLIDVTLTTSSVPDQNSEMRIRTTASELDNIGYGVSDSMGMRECVSTRDVFIQKFRGNENEVLIVSIDGKLGCGNVGHRVSSAIKTIFVGIFTSELNKLKESEVVQDAIRRTFLALNREINGTLAHLKSSGNQSKGDLDLSLRYDSSAGAAITMVYIKDKMLYTANVGDIEALLCYSNGEHTLLTTKHDPTTRSEFERVRASGGYVSGDGLLDGELPISRGIGFFDFLPHTHSGPDTTDLDITGLRDGTIIIATKVVWNFISYELAVDIIRQVKDDPMRAAQKLRDFAICYGASDKISVIVITLGEQKAKSKYAGVFSPKDDIMFKKRRGDRSLAGDSILRRLDEEIDPPIGELALVFTDIKNSTLLWDAYPVAMRSAIKIHNAIMRRQLRIVGGYEVKTEGDAFMCSFPSPSSALLWTFSVQQQLLTADWPKEILQTDQCCEITDAKKNIIFRGLSVRMGIHWGTPVYELDVVTRRMDYFGPMVNRSARIQAVADGGQIAVSSDFLDEMDGLFKIHNDIKNGKTTLEESYQGNIAAGEMIEKELSQIEELGHVHYPLGEKKLKGLETPEMITLVYPSKLKIRYDIFSQNTQSDENIKNQNVGLPVECIFGIRSISLRLENISSMFSEGIRKHQSFQNTSSQNISASVSFKDQDLVELLNHITTRIEHCVAMMELRQQLSLVKGGDGKIDVAEPKPVFEIMNEFTNMIQSLKNEKYL